MKIKGIGSFVLLIVAFAVGGLLLTNGGKDAVSVAAEKKDSLLMSDQISVSFQQIGGHVINIPVQEGQKVKKGTVLMQLDPLDTDLQIAKLKTQISGMEVQIKQAEKNLGNQDIIKQQEAVSLAEETLSYTKKNFERMKSLYENNGCSQSTFDDAQLKLTSAENALNQNKELLKKYQSSLDSATLNIPILQQQKEALEVQLAIYNEQKNRLILKAPSDGTILRMMPKIGENVSAGTPVAMLQSSDLYFDLYVPETEVNQFKVGKTASVHVIALNQFVSGTVQFINSAPQYTSMRMSRENGQADLSTFQVRIYMNSSEKLLPGMTVEVKMDAAT